MSRRNRRPLFTCKNCDTKILPEDAFCKNCGQENHDHHLTMKAMFYEFVEGITHFDNKIVSSYKNLLFKPGKLTKDYISGKRVSYVPPVRLYIFTAFVYFFLVGLMLSKITKKINEIRNDSFNELYNSSKIINISKSALYQIQENKNDDAVLKILKQKLIKQKDSIYLLKDKVKNADYLKNINESLVFCNPKYIDSIKIVELKGDSVKIDLVGTAFKESVGKIIKLSELDSAFTETIGQHRIILFKKPIYDTISSDKNLSITKDVMQRVYLNSTKTDSLIKANNLGFFAAKKWKAVISVAGTSRLGTSHERDAFMEEAGHKFTKYSSFAMYLMMPLSALLLWLFFYRKEKLYFPHFLFSMHVQTANFIFIIIGVGLVLLFRFMNLSFWFSRITIVLLILLLLIYFYKALRCFYKESAKKTIWKVAIIALLYTILFSTLTSGIGIMAFFN